MDERVTGVDFYNMDTNEKVFMTITSGACDAHHIPVACYTVDCRNLCLNKEKSGTLQAKNQGGHSLNYQNPVLINVENSSGKGIATTLDSHYFKGCGEREGIEREIVAYERDWYSCGNGQSVTIGLSPVSHTLDCMHDQKFIVGCSQEEEGRKYVLRRLTPVECARLQGFPDWWTDGANGSDSSIYKMWGNGIALPCAADVIGRLAKELQKDGDGE